MTETKPLGGPLDPIQWASRYGERRAEREQEERLNPALVCERSGAHILTWADPACLVCGEDV